MKRISINVEFRCEVNNDVREEDLTFGIPMELVIPQDANGRQCGSLLGYTTEQYWDVEEPE